MPLTRSLWTNLWATESSNQSKTWSREKQRRAQTLFGWFDVANLQLVPFLTDFWGLWDVSFRDYKPLILYRRHGHVSVFGKEHPNQLVVMMRWWRGHQPQSVTTHFDIKNIICHGNHHFSPPRGCVINSCLCSVPAKRATLFSIFGSPLAELVYVWVNWIIYMHSVMAT